MNKKINNLQFEWHGDCPIDTSLITAYNGPMDERETYEKIFEIGKEIPILELKLMGIYRIQNKLDFKSYIGSSRDVLYRVIEHLRRSHNYLLRKALRKDGRENFVISVLEIVTNASLLKAREKYYMELYETINKNKGYNISIIGQAIEQEDANERDNTRNATSHTEDFYDFNRINKLPTRALVKGASIRTKIKRD